MYVMFMNITYLIRILCSLWTDKKTPSDYFVTTLRWTSRNSFHFSFDTSCLSVLFAKTAMAVSPYGARCFQCVSLQDRCFSYGEIKTTASLQLSITMKEMEKVTRQVLCLNCVFILKVRVWKEGFYPFRMLEMTIEVKLIKLIDCSWSYMNFPYFSHKILKTKACSGFGWVW